MAQATVAPPPVSIEDQIKCVQREIRHRQYVYPKRFDAGKMTAPEMAREIRQMEAVLATLQGMRTDLLSTLDPPKS